MTTGKHPDQPMKYRKKHIVIEAMHFATETDGEAVIDWIAANGGRVVGSRGHVDGRRYEFSIDTLEGVMRAEPGDWIIRGVAGEFYPCKPDIFEQTYEKADRPGVAAPINAIAAVRAYTVRLQEQATASGFADEPEFVHTLAALHDVDRLIATALGENDDDDEPMFILLARDAHAPELVHQWADRRAAAGELHEKVAEALACADAMEAWRSEHEWCEGCNRLVSEGEYHTDSEGVVLCDAECWPEMVRQWEHERVGER